MASLLDSKVVATELISKPQTLAAPKYRFMKVFPTRGTADVSFGPNARVQVQFEIPTQSFNYSKSYICGTITLPAPINPTDNHWVYRDCTAWCSRASFKTRSGAILFDLDYVGNYTKTVNRFETSLDELMSTDSTDILFSNRPPIIATQLENKRPNNEDINHPNVEPVYCTTRGAVNQPYAVPFRIPLSKLVPNSVFSRKSDLKFPEIAILTLTVGPGTKVSWINTAIGNPVTGAADCTVVSAISDFHLYMARQDDPIYEAMFEERLQNGFVIPINVPIQTMTQIDAPGVGGVQSVAVTYNSGHGHRLVKIYHSVFDPADSKNLAYDNNCATVRKVISYYAKVQGVRTTDDDLATDPDDPSAYLYHKSLLEDTSVTNARIYHANFAHIEDVGRIGGPKRWKELGFRKDDADVGVPLTQDYKFEFVARTTNNMYHHYTFAIVQRLLKVNASAVVVE